MSLYQEYRLDGSKLVPVEMNNKMIDNYCRLLIKYIDQQLDEYKEIRCKYDDMEMLLYYVQDELKERENIKSVTFQVSKDNEWVTKRKSKAMQDLVNKYIR